jgi:predicted DsbA family dithiol-disulfide isomerase
MIVNIWSDVRCPFCYIGKRKFEKALEKFEHKDEVEVVWKSFELDPTLETQTEVNIYDYFADMKGMPRQQAVEMFGHVTAVAKEVGLDFNLEASVIANSFNAHRLIQYAKYKGLGDSIEEQLFRMHFIEAKNIDDLKVLMEAGGAIGLDPDELKEVLSTDAFTDEVKLDELAAQQIGVRGVPFFVFDDKYGVSGAQSPDVFLETLEKAWAEATTA